jgi:hypothetical protein
MRAREFGRLRAVPLAEVLARLGAERDPHDGARWRTPRGPVSVTGMRFFNWHESAGGGGAIDLVMHLRRVEFPEAVAWLRGAFGLPEALAPQQPERRRRFVPPARDDGNLVRVARYLEQERAIPAEVLEPLLQTNVVYADARANAVFLHRGPRGRPVGAELRGTSRVQWRGMAAGSRKAAGYFAAGPAGAGEIVLCESAIDAMSCVALRPGARAISTAGTHPNPGWLPRLLAAARPVYCGFDADEPGERAAAAMTARHPTIRRLRPEAHDWNDDLVARRACPT